MTHNFPEDPEMLFVCNCQGTGAYKLADGQKVNVIPTKEPLGPCIGCGTDFVPLAQVA